MPLSQRKVGDLFRKADTLEETEELILAYCFSSVGTSRSARGPPLFISPSPASLPEDAAGSRWALQRTTADDRAS